MMHRNTAKALAALTAALTASGAAMAQTTEPTAPAAAPASPLTANVTLTTNYKFRGQDQDVLGKNGFAKTRAVKPAIQGGFDYAFGESGFYVGNWNSSVNWLPGNSIEMDFYGGYKFKGGPIDWDVGILQYYYPGNTAGNVTELYGAGSWADEAIGSFTLKYSHTVSKDYFNYAGASSGSGLRGRNTGYLNLAYSKEIAPKLTLKAAVGYTRMSSDIRSLGFPSYVDYNLGVSYDFGSGLSLAGAVQGANKKSSYLLTSDFLGNTYSPNKARFIVALTKTL